MKDFLILDDDIKNNINNVNNESKVNNKDFMAILNDFVYSFQKIKTKEKVIFFRLLATMTNAWMWLVKSIIVLEKQEKNLMFKKILWRFREEISSGKSLSECMKLYPNSFSEAEIGIIKSWEKTWLLNKVLLDLANQIEKVESLTWKIKWAMIYPLFILAVVIVVIAVMMIVIVPRLLKIFDNKESLPASTKLLITISDIFKNYWYLMILFIIIWYTLLYIWKKTADWKYIYDKLILKVPIFWWISQKLILSKFSRVFSWLLSSWVSVLESLNIASEAVWNEAYKQRILLLNEDVRKWIKIWESLEWDDLFPEMMIQMIQVWEETAKLDQTIIKVAEFYDEQVDNTISILNKLLEPFIIITLALVVWFIAISIMQPIMNLADTISSK